MPVLKGSLRCVDFSEIRASADKDGLVSVPSPRTSKGVTLTMALWNLRNGYFLLYDPNNSFVVDYIGNVMFKSPVALAIGDCVYEYGQAKLNLTKGELRVTDMANTVCEVFSISGSFNGTEACSEQAKVGDEEVTVVPETPEPECATQTAIASQVECDEAPASQVDDSQAECTQPTYSKSPTYEMDEPATFAVIEEPVIEENGKASKLKPIKRKASTERSLRKRVLMAQSIVAASRASSPVF